MSMRYIRDYYGVPAKRGGRVKYSPDYLLGKYSDRLVRYGTIKSARNGRLNILLDGDKRTSIYHPRWNLEYIAPPTKRHNQ